MKYLLLENSAISSCEILGSQRKLLFSRFLAVFLQIHPKPKVATMSSQRPSQGPLTWIVQFDCKTLANTTKIWQFQVQIPFDRFCRQIYSPRATCCDCTNFYFKWLRATPKFATSIWTNRRISSILVSWNILYTLSNFLCASHLPLDHSSFIVVAWSWDNFYSIRFLWCPKDLVSQFAGVGWFESQSNPKARLSAKAATSKLWCGALAFHFTFTS
jgi:hypothetical protein